jgi:hypothetical protein
MKKLIGEEKWKKKILKRWISMKRWH